MGSNDLLDKWKKGNTCLFVGNLWMPWRYIPLCPEKKGYLKATAWITSEYG